MLPGQQGCPADPQAEHTEVEDVPPQTKPLAVQVVVVELLLIPLGVVLQQVAPAVFPHRAHTPEEHLVFAAVQ
jgi:hypothetical protein